MELFRALGAFIEPPHAGTAALADALELGECPAPTEYTDIFLLQLYPYASVYLGAEGMLGGDARDRIAGFWRALSVEPPSECDHIAVMLAFYAGLLEAEAQEDDPRRRAGIHAARCAFLREHLASWIIAYASKLSEIADGAYGRWAELLVGAIAHEIAGAGLPTLLPLHMREAPEFGDARNSGAAEFLSSVLSPIRSGIILVRADVARAARTLQAGTRMGDRACMLRSLLGQDAPGTLRWLADEAARWEALHRSTEPLLGPAGAFWTGRAGNAAAVLRALAVEAT